MHPFFYSFLRSLPIIPSLLLSSLEGQTLSPVPAPETKTLSQPLNGPSVDVSSASSESSESIPDYSDILDFWFGSLPDPDYFPENKLSIWFSETPEVDRQIREEFSPMILDALNGRYNHWRDTPKGRLALIILLNQFPRHIYRGTSQEFMFDSMAKSIVLEGLQSGDDKTLYPIEKAFFYLPLEYLEDLDMQNLAASHYRKLLADSPGNLKPVMDAFLKYSLMHRDQIIRFGRFPHRNSVLGRKPTAEEIVFLKQWGKPSFTGRP